MRFYDFCDMFGISIYLTQKANSDEWKCVLEGMQIKKFKSDEMNNLSATANSIREVLREVCNILEYVEFVHIGNNEIRVPAVKL